MKLLLSASVLVVSTTLSLGSAGRASDATQGADTSLPPLESYGPETVVISTVPPESDGEVATELPQTTGASDGTSIDVSRYEDALLTVEDLGGDWETEGAEVLDFGPTSEPFAYCPEGVEVMPPAAATGIYFTAPQTAEVNSLTDDDVSELVLVFAAPADVTTWFAGIDSCVGRAWEESSDPVEHVTLERVEAPDLGDESRAFRTIYAHSEGPEHDKTAVLVRLGEVLVIVEYGNYGLEEPIDRQFFDAVVETAVAKVDSAVA